MKFLVAVLTPFDDRGRVDLSRLRAHVLWLMAEGVDGFVPTAVTGEFLYLSDREREAIHRTVLDTAGHHPVYPCTWDPSPATTTYLTDAARDHGAKGVVLPPPLLYEVDEDLIRSWYATVARSGLPVYGYHDPQRLQTSLVPELYAQLRSDGVLAGLMDASRDRWRVERLARDHPGSIFAGGDRLLPAAGDIEALGGFVSAIANAWPSFCLRLVREGDHHLEDALVERVTRVDRAGGLRALKALLSMGCRAPLLAPQTAALDGLPPAEI